MQDYNSSVDKRSGGILARHGTKAYLLSLLLPFYGVGVIIGVAPATPLLWAVVLGVVVIGLSIDVFSRQLTHDTWKPHGLFWASMITTIPLSMGVSGIVVVPGYLLEKVLAT